MATQGHSSRRWIFLACSVLFGAAYGLAWRAVNRHLIAVMPGTGTLPELTGELLPGPFMLAVAYFLLNAVVVTSAAPVLLPLRAASDLTSRWRRRATVVMALVAASVVAAAHFLELGGFVGGRLGRRVVSLIALPATLAFVTVLLLARRFAFGVATVEATGGVRPTRAGRRSASLLAGGAAIAVVLAVVAAGGLRGAGLVQVHFLAVGVACVILLVPRLGSNGLLGFGICTSVAVSVPFLGLRGESGLVGTAILALDFAQALALMVLDGVLRLLGRVLEPFGTSATDLGKDERPSP